MQLRKLCREKHTIVLTYDDGPGSRLTLKLLDLLNSCQADASFFPLGSKLKSERVLYGRQEIGSHSFSHLNAWGNNPIAVYHDIDCGLRATSQIQPTRLFRPPHGKTTLATICQIMARDCTVAWWTIDSTDTWDTTDAIENVLDEIRCQGGGVILLHDHDRPDSPEREDYVFRLTQAILEMAQKEKYRICRFSDLSNG